jgi:phosphoribosylanthranilate isomerase
VEGQEAHELAQELAVEANALLLDSGRPSAPTPELGGTGRAHDWSVSRRIVEASPIPVFLAGGLNPANVAEAVAKVRPFGLDLCTGVRTNDRLDPPKLASFFSAF